MIGALGTLLAGALKAAAGLPWLRIARIAAPVLVISLLIGWALVTRTMLESTRVQRDAAIADVAEFRRLATDATVTAGPDGTRALLSVPDAKAALAGAFRDRDDARSQLRSISQRTTEAKTRSDDADAALTQAQARNAAAFEGAAPRIAALAAAKPTGKADEDAAAIAKDSGAPWEGWK